MLLMFRIPSTEIAAQGFAAQFLHLYEETPPVMMPFGQKLLAPGEGQERNYQEYPLTLERCGIAAKRHSLTFLIVLWTNPEDLG